jgi:membrane fusion protein, copper/silver efflux system
MNRAAFLALGLALLAGCGGTATTAPTPVSTATPAATTAGTQAAQTARWTCPMHPDVIQDHPGKCPKCGMDLIRLSAPVVASPPKEMPPMTNPAPQTPPPAPN